MTQSGEPKNALVRGNGTQLNLQRVPDSLHAAAKKGTYQRSVPYPEASIIDDFAAEPFIGRGTRIATIGSCFAQELSGWLTRNDYNCLPNHWGVVYTPKSIEQIIRLSFEDWHQELAEPFWVMNGHYYFPYIKAADHSGPLLLGDSENTATDQLIRYIDTSRDALSHVDVLVLTLGLTELWRNKQDLSAFFAIPYPDVYQPEHHEFYSMTFDDVMSSLQYSIETLRKVNPGINILLSVSPIPLSVTFRDRLGPYVATQFSKSLLHTAALTTVHKYSHVHYMPSYEIVRNKPVEYYSEDGRHVTKECVGQVMAAFNKLYVEPDGVK
ncbi:GSCFA domain-containing protein [Aestuariibacter salexigens]|uniref:GSCFA domain-containing protein n=1 Tax=Aestuariibacter salexigens TaxID=226010 RepID=UPI0004156BC5|nr:GSCFA domain-containing protein [Aestuariibacter salexigens]